MFTKKPIKILITVLVVISCAGSARGEFIDTAIDSTIESALILDADLSMSSRWMDYDLTGLSTGDMDAIAHDILSYLAEHPDATDSLAGVANWWLDAATHGGASVPEPASAILLGIGVTGTMLLRRRRRQ